MAYAMSLSKVERLDNFCNAVTYSGQSAKLSISVAGQYLNTISLGFRSPLTSYIFVTVEFVAQMLMLKCSVKLGASLDKKR